MKSHGILLKFVYEPWGVFVNKNVLNDRSFDHPKHLLKPMGTKIFIKLMLPILFI